MNIFDQFEWEKNESPNKLFKRFVNRLEKLDSEEQDFILDLTEYYRMYSLLDYEEMLIECLMLLDEQKYFDDKKVIVAPLLIHTDIISNLKKVKSSNLMAYLMKSNQLSYLDFLLDTDIKVYNFLDQNNFQEVIENRAKLILIDDYIGSGGTAKLSIESYLEKGLSLDDIMIMSLVIDPIGEKLLKDIGVTYVKTNRDYFKAIDVIEDEEKVRRHLRKIAKKIKVSTDYFAGYKETMSLISLVRTPNNTLPFYWSEKSKKNKAPFPRFKE